MLEQFEKAAYTAHYWNSFNPDRAANYTLKEFSADLENDLEEIRQGGADQETADSYQKKYESLFGQWLAKKSRTASAAVTGPARFPTQRNQKALRSEHSHYEVFQEWRTRAKKAILRKAKEPKTYESELVRYRAELEGMKANHEKMKLANAAMKKKGADKVQILVSMFPFMSDFDVEWACKWGFGLQNNLANIKRVEERIQVLESKQGKEDSEKVYSWGKIELSYTDDRMRIRHNERPDSDTTTLLKKNGFKWSPSNGAWQRQITGNAFWSLNHYILPALGN